MKLKNIGEICSWSLGDLRKYIAGAGGNWEDAADNKAELIRRAHEAASKSTTASGNSAQRPISPRSLYRGICTMSSSELKKFITDNGSSHRDCEEKSALIRRAHQSTEPIRAYPANPTTQTPHKPAGLFPPVQTPHDSGSQSQAPGCPVALALGQRIYAGETTKGRSGRISKHLLSELGGRDTFVAIFEEFYNRMFADPRMAPLFGWRTKELPTAEHGRRLGTFILSFNGLSSEYQQTAHDGFRRAHQHAKRCPMRPVEHQERAIFTVQQRASWLGNLSLACDAKQVPERIKEEILAWCLSKINIYGPWMEE